MLEKFPTADDIARGDQHRRRLDWHALLARLEAERDWRHSLGEDACVRGIAVLMAGGSFDPRAAETIFALAAGQAERAIGYLPSAQAFAPVDLAQAAAAIADGGACLRNAKPSQANADQRGVTSAPRTRRNENRA